MDLPRLGVRSRGRARSDLKNAFDVLPRNALAQESANRASRSDRSVYVDGGDDVAHLRELPEASRDFIAEVFHRRREPASVTTGATIMTIRYYKLTFASS